MKALGHMAELCGELISAASKDPAVRSAISCTAQWSKVLTYFNSSQQEDNCCGLDIDQMVMLFGPSPSRAMRDKSQSCSQSTSPVRCFMSPARSPGSSGSQSMSLEYQSDPDDDSEIMLVAEQLETTDLCATDNAEVVHQRTPIRARPAPNQGLLNPAKQEKENSPPGVPERVGTPIPMEQDDTPKKMVVDHMSVRSSSNFGDTPQPKLISVSARSRTFYAREAKTKSPFGQKNCEKESASSSEESSSDSPIAKKLF